MALLIKNGEIVTASQRYRADIWCEDETITRIAADIDPPPAAEVIDAGGKYVFPGFVDPHAHVHLPTGDGFGKDTYETASRAALLGGTTTVFDMCTPGRHDDPRAALELWDSLSRGRSACDYSFHMSVTRFDDRVERQLREIVTGGIPSFKVYLAYRDTLGITDEELYRTLRLARELGVIVMAHCENAALIAERQAEFVTAGKLGPQWHEPSRPPAVEADGVHHLATFAELTGAHAYIVHLSCEEALREALAARDRGVKLWIETLIQHLLLDKTCAERPGVEGAKWVMSPPLRDRRHQDVLWNALRSGLIDTVASDHAPFDCAGQKMLGQDDFTRIPNGLPGLQDRVNLLYTYGVAAGRIDLHRFVDAASTQPARLFGLLPRKGTIQPGSDADLVVYDPNYRGIISARTHAMNVDYSAYEGFEIHGRPQVVTVRGQVAVRDGEFVGTIGRGRLLSREPTHFS